MGRGEKGNAAVEIGIEPCISERPGGVLLWRGTIWRHGACFGTSVRIVEWGRKRLQLNIEPYYLRFDGEDWNLPVEELEQALAWDESFS